MKEYIIPDDFLDYETMASADGQGFLRELVRCGECVHYHDEDDPAYCDELCTIHIKETDGCLRGIKRGAEVGYRADDGERKDGERDDRTD